MNQKIYRIIPTLGFNLDVAKFLNQLKSLKSHKLDLIIDYDDIETNLLLNLSEKDKDKYINILKNVEPNILLKPYEIKDKQTQLKYELKHHFSNALIKDNPSNIVSLLFNLTNNKDIRLVFSIKSYHSIRVNYLRRRILSGQNKIYNLIRPTEILYFIINKHLKVLESILIKHSDRFQPISDRGSVTRLDKLYSNLFRMDLKIETNSLDNLKQINELITAANKDNGQRLRRTKYKPRYLRNNIYSSEEIAKLLNLNDLTEYLTINKIKQLKPNQAYLDGSIQLGINSSLPSNRRILIPESNQSGHMLILGSTGTGKSTLIYNMINHQKDSGFTLIDPHGDLSKKVKDILGPSLIYLDPTTSNIRINLLERKYKKNDYRYEIECEHIIEQVVSILSKLFSEDDHMGSRIEYILRMATKTALQVENASLGTIYRLLVDDNFNKKVVSLIEDTRIKSFWQLELGKAGDYQKTKLIIGITSKLGRLINSKTTGPILNCAKSNIDFDEIISNKKQLVCNLSKGSLGERNSNLLGSLILAKLQLSAYRSSREDEGKRVQHSLYVDEFQNYSTPSFIQLLSESRKYKINLIMAEQSLAQQDDQINSIILANISNLVLFRTTSLKDKLHLKPIIGSDISEDIGSLPSYHCYYKSMGVSSLDPVNVFL